VALKALPPVPPGSVLTLDAAPIIYYLEDHPRMARRYAPLFEAATAGALTIAISAITIAEVLVGPLTAGKELLAEQYREALAGASGFEVVVVDAGLAVLAARLRARYRLRLPDAIQVATAVRTDSYALVTADRDFKGVSDLRVLS
jgi:predicted nucleic acid-binding protein